MKIRIAAKCSDLFFMENLETGQEYQGYVPPFLGEDKDYVDLEIDVKTGQITNWHTDIDVVNEFFNEQEG